MKLRKVVPAGIVTGFIFIGLIETVRGQPPAPAGAEESYPRTVQPVLAKYCYSCHNDKLNTSDLSLEAFRDPRLAVKQTAVWAKVLDKVSTGQMPPSGVPAPTKP